MKFTPPAKDNDLPKMQHGVDMMDYNEIFISHWNFENFFNLKQNWFHLVFNHLSLYTSRETQLY